MIVEVAVVGTGFMGRNHARVLSQMPGAHLAAIVDVDAPRAQALAMEYGCSWAPSLEALGGKVDAVVLAVPTHLHHELGMQVIAAGMHLLVEKPIAETPEQARELVEAAAARGVTLATGHIERFNPVCLDLPIYVKDPQFIQTRRMSPYSDRISEGVIRDMMVHDLDLVLWLAESDVVSVSAESLSPRSATEDLATATIRFASGTVAQCTVTRVAQRKVRQLEVVQDDCTITVDLLRQDINLFRQTKVDQVVNGSVRFRETSVMEIPYLTRRGEPLWLELEDFIDAVGSRRAPLVSGEAGLAALELCDQVLESAATGRTLELAPATA